MNDNITGIILAGGKSRRMGEDKSFVLFSGKSLIEIAIDKLSPLFKDLIIVTNKPHLYQRYGITTQPDLLKDRGPLGGIYTGLVTSKSIYNFIVACDMPFLSPALVQFMVDKINGYDVVIAKWNNRFQPLCAIYSKNCISSIEKELSKNNFKITDFLKYVRIRKIGEKEIARFDSTGLCFVNINTPLDIQNLEQYEIARRTIENSI